MHKKYFCKLFVLIVFLIIVAIIILTASTLKTKKPGSFDTVLYIDGEPVMYGEFMHYMQKETSEVFTYFQNKYGAEDSIDFWSTAYEGEIPIERLKQATLKSCIRDKVQQLMAKKNNIIEITSYKELISEIGAINKKRAEMLKNNQVIYGPIKYDEQRYFDEVMLNTKRDLKDTIKVNFIFTEKDYTDYYENNKDKYSLGYSRKSRAVVAQFADENDKNKKLHTVLPELESLQSRISSGESFYDLYNQLQNSLNVGLLKPIEQTFDYSTMKRTFAIENPALAQEINNMAEGDITDIIEGISTIGIYECIEVKTLGYMPIDTVKAEITDSLITSRYEEAVDNWVENAKVEINEEVMQRIKY